MNKFLLSSAMIAAAAMTSSYVYAEGAYAGLSVTTTGTAFIQNGTGARIKNSDRPLPIKLYGGVNLTENFAIEGGYGYWGTHKFDMEAAGTIDQPRLDASTLYVAARGTIALNDSFSLFGKLGMARNRIELSGVGAHSGSSTLMRPMIGFGAEYHITKNVALALEFEHFGSKRTPTSSYSMKKLEVGLKYSF